MTHPFFLLRTKSTKSTPFNPDKNKQAQEVVFSLKQSKSKHSQVLFNKTPATYSSSQRHLGIILDEKINFTNHIELKIHKASIKSTSSTSCPYNL